MPFYVTDPDSPGKHVDVIELQRRNPYKTLPPVLIKDWLRHDLWTRIQAIQLLAGYIPDNQLSITNPKRYLDGTSDVQLSPLIHPIRDEILSNIMTLSNWAGLSEANETKPPQEWLSWAKEKGFTPYWLEYVEAIQSAENGGNLMMHNPFVERQPAKLFGAGHSEEMQQITTLTKYLELDTWTPEQAAFLVCGIKPETVTDALFGKAIRNAKSLNGSGITEQNSTAFSQAARVLELWHSQERPPTKIKPGEFVTWCKSKNVDTSWLSDIDAPTPKVEAGAATPQVNTPQDSAASMGKILAMVGHGLLFTEVVKLEAVEALQNNPSANNLFERYVSLKGKSAGKHEPMPPPHLADATPTPKAETGTGITTHQLKTKDMPLDAEIVTAKSRALDNNNAQSVWDELVKMAYKQEGCLIGEGDLNELQYGSRQDPIIFTKKMLADRMRGRKNRAKPR